MGVLLHDVPEYRDGFIVLVHVHIYLADIQLCGNKVRVLGIIVVQAFIFADGLVVVLIVFIGFCNLKQGIIGEGRGLGYQFQGGNLIVVPVLQPEYKPLLVKGIIAFRGLHVNNVVIPVQRLGIIFEGKIAIGFS